MSKIKAKAAATSFAELEEKKANNFFELDNNKEQHKTAISAGVNKFNSLQYIKRPSSRRGHTKG